MEGGSYLPKPVDIWSLGVSIYALMFATLPFTQENFDHELLHKQIQFPPCSDQLRQVLERCLDRNVATRATIEQVAEMAWIK